MWVKDSSVSNYAHSLPCIHYYNILRFIHLTDVVSKEPETFIYDVFSWSPLMDYVKSRAKADNNKNTFFFASFLLHFITEGFFHIESSFNLHSFLWLIQTSAEGSCQILLVFPATFYHLLMQRQKHVEIVSVTQACQARLSD